MLDGNLPETCQRVCFHHCRNSAGLAWPKPTVIWHWGTNLSEMNPASEVAEQFGFWRGPVVCVLVGLIIKTVFSTDYDRNRSHG